MSIINMVQTGPKSFCFLILSHLRRKLNSGKCKFLLNDAGLSLVEMMVSVGMVGIVALGSLSIQKMNLNTQRQNQVVTTAQSLKVRLENLIKNQSSWQATLANNTALACLADQTSCSALAGAQTNFNVYDSDNTIAFSSIGTSTNGFTEAGSACTTFDADGSGCAFGYEITLTPINCVGSCINPSLEIRATLNYAPEIQNVPLATAKYSIGGVPPFVRSSSSQNTSFLLVAADSTNPYDDGGGACCATPPCNGTNYTVTRSLTLRTDPKDIISNIDPGNTATQFTINQPGTYKCSGTAAGFGVNTFQVRLIGGGNVYASAAGYAPKDPFSIQSYLNFDTIFTLTTVPVTFQLDQICNVAPNNVISDPYALGLPSPPYATESIFASVSCVLIDDSN